MVLPIEYQCSAKKFYRRGQISHVLKILLNNVDKEGTNERVNENIKKQIQISWVNISLNLNKMGHFEIYVSNSAKMQARQNSGIQWIQRLHERKSRLYEPCFQKGGS